MLKRGEFIRCSMCGKAEEFSGRPVGTWWTLAFEGPSRPPSIEINGETVAPPFYFCSADHLKTVVSSTQFQQAARAQEKPDR